jgi:hypothetical protein
VRCGRCGNENAGSNRFCGMCGAPLVAKATAQPAGPGSVAAPVAPSRTEPRTEPKSGPVITGPSFLGLNIPAVEERGGDRHPQDRRPEPGRDPLQPSSKNLDYLLEDEEEPKRGPGKLILVVVALLLALGFGYLRWKQGGFDWMSGSKQPAAATTPEAGQSGADSGGGAAATPNSNSANPQAGASGAPATAAGGATSADSTTAQAPPPATGTPVTSSPGTSSPGTSSPPTSSVSTPQDAAQTKANDAVVPKDSAAQPAPADADKQPAPAEAPATAKPVTRKPAPVKPAAGRPFDMVAEAERYIYGRGVRQDCEHGMRLLKAAEQSNPKAMISLGAVYSTGTCAPRDLPTAYRWFALALHKEPDNQALQDDLQKLWSQMTPPERQLAIKLSQ